MMPRNECFRKIAELRGDAIVVSTYSSAFEWRKIAPSSFNYFSVGAMGQASSHALGLALGLPEQKVIVLDGDGKRIVAGAMPEVQGTNWGAQIPAAAAHMTA